MKDEQALFSVTITFTSFPDRKDCSRQTDSMIFPNFPLSCQQTRQNKTDLN